PGDLLTLELNGGQVRGSWASVEVNGLLDLHVSQCPVSSGWCDVGRNDQQIDRLIIDAENLYQVNTRVRQPVHGNPSATGQPDSARSAVPPRPGQGDPTDRDSPTCDCLAQRDEL